MKITPEQAAFRRGAAKRSYQSFGGHYIRSYVLSPHQMVKDLRTGITTHDVEGILDGDIQQFLESALTLPKMHCSPVMSECHASLPQPLAPIDTQK